MKKILMGVALGTAVSITSFHANSETYSAQHEKVKQLFQSSEKNSKRCRVDFNRYIQS